MFTNYKNEIKYTHYAYTLYIHFTHTKYTQHTLHKHKTQNIGLYDTLSISQ